MASALAVTIVVLVLAPDAEPPADVAGSTDPPVPTTAAISEETVEGFVASFRVAIDAQDVGFLLERLHPIVIQAYGVEACRSLIQGEILELENYEQTGPALGPIIRVLDTGNRSVTAQTYEVPVSFDFGGGHHEDTALLGLSGGIMHWFVQCR